MTEANRNLALRVASAILLFPFLMWVTWHGGLAFAALCAAAAALCAGELTAMFAPRGKTEIFAISFSALIPLAPWWAHARNGGVYPEWMGVALGAAAMVLLAGALFRDAPPHEAPRRVTAGALSWLYCGIAVASVVATRMRFGFGWVLLAFVVTWANDTLAYFAGRFFGKHLLLPQISPKKTWEGFAGGAVGSIGGALLVHALFPASWSPGLTAGGAAAAGAVGALLGPTGDLVESMLKRASGVKDSGQLIPGHGGLLDRIDALLFVAPWIYLCALAAS